MPVEMPVESDVARIRFKADLLRQKQQDFVPCDIYLRDVATLLDAVEIAQEGRRLAEQRAKADVQQEMAALRAERSRLIHAIESLAR